MKKRGKTKKEIDQKAELKKEGWKLQRKIVTGEIWGKGDERIHYDPKKKEVLHQFTV